MSTQEEIRAEKQKLDAERDRLYVEGEIVKLKMQIVWTKCKHPDKYEYSAMGDLGWKCPDCGWAT